MWGFSFAIKFVMIFIKTRRLFYKVKLYLYSFKQKEHAKCIRFRIQLQLRRRCISWSSFKTIYYDIGGKIKKVKKQIISTNQDPHRNMGVFYLVYWKIFRIFVKRN